MHPSSHMFCLVDYQSFFVCYELCLNSVLLFLSRVMGSPFLLVFRPWYLLLCCIQKCLHFWVVFQQFFYCTYLLGSFVDFLWQRYAPLNQWLQMPDIPEHIALV